jgi:hypothetical protein
VLWNAKVHTFHMVSLFGRTVFAKKMTFYPSTTLGRAQVLVAGGNGEAKELENDDAPPGTTWTAKAPLLTEAFPRFPHCGGKKVRSAYKVRYVWSSRNYSLYELRYYLKNHRPFSVWLWGLWDGRCVLLTSDADSPGSFSYKKGRMHTHMI